MQFAVHRLRCQYPCADRGFGVLMRSDPTRLETRTKESNMCASTRVPNPCAQVIQIALALTGASRVVKRLFPSQEHVYWDPKDGELGLCRAKSRETLMEARSDTDVQIVRLT